MSIPGTHLISNEDFWDTHFQHLNLQEPDIAFAYLATIKCTKTKLEISKTITDVRSRHRELGISWSIPSCSDPPTDFEITWEDDPRTQFRREMTSAAIGVGIEVPGFLSLNDSNEGGSEVIACAPEHQIKPESLEPVKPFDIIKIEDSPPNPSPVAMSNDRLHGVEGAKISKTSPRRGRASGDAATVKCPVDGCTKVYTTKAGLKYHNRNAHGNSIHKCPKCREGFKGPASLSKHTSRCLGFVTYSVPGSVDYFALEERAEGSNGPGLEGLKNQGAPNFMQDEK